MPIRNIGKQLSFTRSVTTSGDATGN